MHSSGDLLKKTDELLLKVKRLTERYQKACTDLAAKDEKVKWLENKLADSESSIEKMKTEVAAVRMGSKINYTEDERKELKSKINDYIKEIDKVISNLSSQD